MHDTSKEKEQPLRPLPHSKEAEVAFLGAILLGIEGVHEQMEKLEWTDFFLPFHRVIYRTLKTLYARGMPTDDLAILCDSLAGTDELGAAGGAGYVSSLLDGIPKTANICYYADAIREKSQARRLIYLYESNIDKLLTANGNLSGVIQEIETDSAHTRVDFGRKDNERPLFQTGADLIQDSISPEFAVEPYVLAGAVTELVAKIKAGKTTYVLGEIVCKAITKGPVVYLTEQPTASFRVALQRAGLIGTKNLFILPFNAVVGRPWSDIAKIAIKKCREVGALLLVVDTLSHFCGLEGDSENDSGAAIACMKPLQEAAAVGIAVLTIRHERKSGGEIGDAGRGSSAFGGAADTLLTLRRPEGRTRPTLRKIECVSRFEGLPSEAIFEYRDGRYEYMGKENEIAEREAEEAILAGAPHSEEKAETLDQLLNGSEIARTTAQRVVKKLVNEGRLKQTGGGKKRNPFRYFLSECHSAQTSPINGRSENVPSQEGF